MLDDKGCMDYVCEMEGLKSHRHESFKNSRRCLSRPTVNTDRSLLWLAVGLYELLYMRFVAIKSTCSLSYTLIIHWAFMFFQPCQSTLMQKISRTSSIGDRSIS
jgi:hypothetical protein